MLHFQMCNISDFAQISSVLAQRSTVPTIGYYCEVVLKRACCLTSEQKYCRHK